MEEEQQSQISLLPRQTDVPRETIEESFSNKRVKEMLSQIEGELPKGPGKLMIYFHGNAEDLGTSFQLLSGLREILKVRVLAMEYRGYGLFGGSAKCSEGVLEDALTVFDFCTDFLEINPQDIFLVGRSIGCSMASHVARYRKPSFLILISPFKTLQEAVAAVVGGLLSYLVAERFNNCESLKHVTAPVMIIHGQKDELIPFSQSQELIDACVNSRHSTLLTPPDMTHNRFDINLDFIIPLLDFCSQIKVNLRRCSCPIKKALNSLEPKLISLLEGQ